MSGKLEAYNELLDMGGHITVRAVKWRRHELMKEIQNEMQKPIK